VNIPAAGSEDDFRVWPNHMDRLGSGQVAMHQIVTHEFVGLDNACQGKNIYIR